MSTGIEISNQLEAFVQAAKRLEVALGQERARARLLEHELLKTQTAQASLMQEQQQRDQQIQEQESRFRAAVSEQRSLEQQLGDKVKELSAELEKTRNELGRYQKAWKDVLLREREAKMIIADGAIQQKKSVDFDSERKLIEDRLIEERKLREQADRDAKTRMLRLHAAESKVQELQSRLKSAHDALKLSHDRAASLSTALMTEKQRFDKTARLLSAEAERMRVVQPLEEMLRARELEIQAARAEMKELPPGHPQMIRLQKRVDESTAQRDELRKRIGLQQKRIDEFLDKVRQAVDHNTYMAEPAS